MKITEGLAIALVDLLYVNTKIFHLVISASEILNLFRVLILRAIHTEVLKVLEAPHSRSDVLRVKHLMDALGK